MSDTQRIWDESRRQRDRYLIPSKAMTTISPSSNTQSKRQPDVFPFSNTQPKRPHDVFPSSNNQRIQGTIAVGSTYSSWRANPLRDWHTTTNEPPTLYESKTWSIFDAQQSCGQKRWLEPLQYSTNWRHNWYSILNRRISYAQLSGIVSWSCHNKDVVLVMAHQQCSSRSILNLSYESLIYNGRTNRESATWMHSILPSRTRSQLLLTNFINFFTSDL